MYADLTWANLGRGERVVGYSRTDPVWLLRQTLLVLLLVMVVLWFDAPGSIAYTLFRATVAVAIVAAAVLPRQIERVVTTERVVTRGATGRVRDRLLGEIRTIATHQDLMARGLGFGSLVLHGEGWRLRIHGIDDPGALSAAIVAQRPASIAATATAWPALSNRRVLVFGAVAPIVLGFNVVATHSDDGPSQYTDPVVATSDARDVMTAYLATVIGGRFPTAYGELCDRDRLQLSEADYETFLGGPPLTGFQVLAGVAEPGVVILTLDLTFGGNTTKIRVWMHVIEQRNGMRACDGPGERDPA